MPVEKEGFASRWARRKQEVANKHETSVADIVIEEEIVIDEATLAEQRLEKLNALTDEDMPDIETLDEDSDFSGFMSTGVSEALRKMALKKLFHGKTYNVRDGLDEYDGDYTSFEKLDPNAITSDMKHILEVEADKLLAEEKVQEEFLKAETGDDIEVADIDSETEQQETEGQCETEVMVEKVDETDEMELNDVKGEEV